MMQLTVVYVSHVAPVLTGHVECIYPVSKDDTGYMLHSQIHAELKQFVVAV